MRGIILAGISIALAGCGTLEPNADVPRGVYAGIDGRQVSPQDGNITITDAGPSVPDGGKYVRGYSCQNKMWQAAASESNATNLMKKQAIELGMNAIHSVKVEKDFASVAKNCWSGISAVGIAYHK